MKTRPPELNGGAPPPRSGQSILQLNPQGQPSSNNGEVGKEVARVTHDTTDDGTTITTPKVDDQGNGARTKLDKGSFDGGSGFGRSLTEPVDPEGRWATGEVAGAPRCTGPDPDKKQQ